MEECGQNLMGIPFLKGIYIAYSVYGEKEYFVDSFVVRQNFFHFSATSNFHDDKSKSNQSNITHKSFNKNFFMGEINVPQKQFVMREGELSNGNIILFVL